VGLGGGVLLLVVVLVVILVIFAKRSGRTSTSMTDLPATRYSVEAQPGNVGLTQMTSQTVQMGGNNSLGVNPYAKFPQGQSPAISPSSSKQVNPFRSPSSSKEIDYRELSFGMELGRGAYGVVFRGEWRGGPVAIKQIFNTFSENDLQAFRSEAGVMANLRPHSNVVQFLGITSNPKLCIVTEFLEGGSLYNMINSEAKINMEMVQTWVAGISAGMLHIHSEGVFHRDLAARNVLLTRGGMTKISDFGLSRMGGSSSQTVSQTGPLKWMAPESIRNRVYSVQSDVWSFGVTLWEIVCRQEPFPELDAVQAALEVTQGSPPLRLQPPSYCPLILVRLMKQCFVTEPANRPDFRAINLILKQARPEDWNIVNSADPNTRNPTSYGMMPTIF